MSKKVVAALLIAAMLAVPSSAAAQSSILPTKDDLKWVGVIVGAVVGGALLAAFVKTRQPKLACDGRPDFCLTVRSQLNMNVDLYVDGRSIGTLGGGKERRIPLQANRRVDVNYCWLQNPGSLLNPGQRYCSDPEPHQMRQNEMKIIYMTQPGVR
jgi:heme A synthase